MYILILLENFWKTVEQKTINNHLDLVKSNTQHETNLMMEKQRKKVEKTFKDISTFCIFNF